MLQYNNNLSGKMKLISSYFRVYEYSTLLRLIDVCVFGF